LLVAFLGRIALTYPVFNDTFDESVHIRAGVEILERHTYTHEAQHPPLGRLVVGVLPYILGGLRLEGRQSLWGGGPWSTGTPEFYWRTLTLARAGNLLFAALLFWTVWRWSRELWGPAAGLGACVLVTCCPNVIAHAGLATLDMPAAATTTLALYCFWRWGRAPGWRSCLASAAALAAAALSKISAVFLLPPLLVAYLAAARRRITLGQGAVFLAAAFLVLWGGYGFQTGTIVPPGHGFYTAYSMGGPNSLPNLVLRAAGHRELPAYRFVHGIIELLSHNEAGHRAYLLGQRSDAGWWYYFPAALAVKTTLPLLLLAGFGLALRRPGVFYPLAAIGLLLAMSMASRLNLGVRYVLAVYPLLAILASAALAAEGRRLRITAVALAAWHAGESVAAHPDYLAYFNELARGREERVLLDSNLDWGQDLARLGGLARERGIDKIRLSYFGLSNPEKLGVPALPLDPGRPVQGWVAVSVNHLVGLYNSPGDFAWLRDRRPVAKAGKSIWVYDLRPGP
jgi:hypothetical protein